MYLMGGTEPLYPVNRNRASGRRGRTKRWSSADMDSGPTGGTDMAVRPAVGHPAHHRVGSRSRHGVLPGKGMTA